MEKAVGAQIRLRAKYIEEGEKSTQYFLSLEKRRQTNNTIKKLINTENVYSTNKEILKYSTSFYKELYKTNNPNQKDIATLANSMYWFPLPFQLPVVI